MAHKTYSVVHNAYCGMTVPLADGMTYQEARDRFKRRIEWFKHTYGGEVIYRGSSCAELCEPETCCFIPDACGTLRIIPDKDVVIQ
jgi:hypothetical protein